MEMLTRSASAIALTDISTCSGFASEFMDGLCDTYELYDECFCDECNSYIKEYYQCVFEYYAAFYVGLTCDFSYDDPNVCPSEDDADDMSWPSCVSDCSVCLEDGDDECIDDCTLIDQGLACSGCESIGYDMSSTVCATISADTCASDEDCLVHEQCLCDQGTSRRLGSHGRQARKLMFGAAGTDCYCGTR